MNPYPENPLAEDPEKTGPELGLPSPVQVAGAHVHPVDMLSVLDWIERAIVTGRRVRMVVVNASKLVLASKDARLRAIISSSDLVTADGMSVVWAARWLGKLIPERVTGIDTMHQLIGRAERLGLSVYFLGGRQEVVEKVADVFKARHPGLKIAGIKNGFFDKNDPEVAIEVSHRSPDILFVAMGSPAQEYWIDQFQELSGARFCLGVGGSFDHAAGVSRRAPLFLQVSGFEWLYRLIMEPKRLWKRYLVGNSRFLLIVILQLIKSTHNSKNR